jgi:translocation and assembly module TamA
MTLSRPLRAAIIAAVAVVSAGCANLASFPGRSPEPQAATAPATVPAVNSRADYRLDVQAPEPLRKLLTEYLDLARFQNAPAAEAIDATELERLLRAAPSQARGLLETEGYFNAEVSVARAGSDEAGVPRVRIVVEPGVRSAVASPAAAAVCRSPVASMRSSAIVARTPGSTTMRTRGTPASSLPARATLTSALK